MRLTLRTLLAYLDDILEPAQAKEIGAKLNESSLASSLVSRIREVMRRRRLTAPTLSGPGVGIDPNSVSEYLDNTLPPDGVADVEKICLESDVHLAEVAACHQILTLALGEPVEVPSQTRERMYALGPSAAKIAIAPLNGTSNGAATLSTGTEELPSEALADVLNQAEAVGRPVAMRSVKPLPHQKPESFQQSLPEYLKPRSPWKKILAYVAAAAVIAVWAVFAFQKSPLKSGSEKDSHGTSPVVAAKSQEGEQTGAEVGDGTEAALAQSPSSNDSDSTDAVDKNAANLASRSRETLEVPPGEATSRPTTRETATRETASIDLPPPEEPEEGAPPFRRKPADKPPLPIDVPDEEETVAPGNAAEKPPVENPPAALPQATPVKYVSSEGVTLHFVPREQRWFVLPRRALVHPGDDLAVPEPFECVLEFEDGRGLVTIPGRTALRWVGPTESLLALIELRRGQLVLRAPTATSGNSEPLAIGVALAGELWQFILEPGSLCGIEMMPNEPTKFEQDPQKDDYSGGIYVGSGKVTVVDPAGKKSPLAGPAWIKLPATGKNPPLITLPKWMGPQSLTSTEKQYARLFEKKFIIDEAVDLSLPAVADNTNPILSRLATEALGLIDAYGPLINILKRTKHDEARRAAISALRMWLPRNAENREALQAELSQLYPPEEATVVYRLLWGFDQADARNRETSLQLLDWMGNADTSICELAFSHVYRLTGKTHDYRASNKPLQRQQSLRHWQSHVVKEGALLPPEKDGEK